MSASNLSIYLCVQTVFQSSLRVKDVFNDTEILHSTALSGDKLPKLSLSKHMWALEIV